MNAAVNAAGLSVLAGLAVALTAGSRAAHNLKMSLLWLKKLWQMLKTQKFLMK